MGLPWARRVVPSTASNVKNQAMVLMQYVNLNGFSRHLSRKYRQWDGGYNRIREIPSLGRYLTSLDHVDGWLVFTIKCEVSIEYRMQATLVFITLGG